ncbi:hypothetical protein AB5N19_12353 [Seiridium cardinale]|uniref:Uncharacterized protein n=1 Tax=Seiridium cardinale TaxID=138064 RepID=A0ABR2XTH2_9PEZI
MSMDEYERELIEDTNRYLEHLGDVRIKYAQYPRALKFKLTRSQPQTYTSEAVAGVFEMDKDNPHLNVDLSSLDIAIVLLRFLQSYVREDHRVCLGALKGEAPANEAQAKDEEEYPLLRLIWADFDYPGPELRRKLIADSAVRRLVFQHLLMRKTAGSPPTFLEITENKDMYQRFWSRPPFLLFHNQMIHRESVEEDWVVEDFDSVPCLTILAEQSKVEWDCKGDLGTLIGSKFGYHEVPGTESEYIRQTGGAAVMRVHMKPSEKSRKKWEDMREIQFNQCIMGKAIRDNTPGTVPIFVPVKMTLVATVHIPRQGSGGLRLYLPTFEQVHLSPAMAKHNNDSVRMGDVDEGEWMLYYVPAPDFRFDDEYPEITPRQRFAHSLDDQRPVAEWHRQNPGAEECETLPKDIMLLLGDSREGEQGTPAGPDQAPIAGATSVAPSSVQNTTATASPGTAGPSSGPPPNAPVAPKGMLQVGYGHTRGGHGGHGSSRVRPRRRNQGKK